jgi:asparagine synthase (glutamine-hydrolysing)
LCGFVCAIGSPDPVRDLVPAAVESLKTRGPDAQVVRSTTDATFGHTRLAIIGLGEEGAQPRGDSESMLVFNGEIYNFREIAAELGIDAKSDVDVMFEVCRRGVKKWISRLRGMYAFVYYERATQTVVAARDPFGIKPLFFNENASAGIQFASTAAALRILEPSLQPDLESLVSFLASGVMIQDRSAFLGIQKLPPGEVWTWTKAGAVWKRSSVAKIAVGIWPRLSVPAALEDSVRAHLVADVEVGVLLSGGIDSTLIAALAAKEVSQLRTYSLTNPENPSIDEAAFASHNAKLIGSIHQEIPANHGDLGRQAQMLIETTGEPFSDAAYLPLSLLTGVAARELKVVLAGEGADELFGGYRRYDAEKLLNMNVVGNLAHMVSSLGSMDRRLAGKASPAVRTIGAAARNGQADKHAYLMFFEWDLVREMFGKNADSAWKDFQGTWNSFSTDPWAFDLPNNRAYDLRVWLTNVFLEKSDRASMVHGLEVRTPYLDPVVALAAMKIKPRNSRKLVLREYLESLLPGVQLPKRKKGLSVDTSTLNRLEFAGVIERTCNDSNSVLVAMGLKNRDAFANAVQSNQSLAFRVAMLGLWQERWL